MVVFSGWSERRWQIGLRRSARIKMSPRTLGRASLLGLLLFVAGWLWGSYFVGVPYQEPTPVQQANEAMHMRISTWAMGIGVFVLLTAGVWSIVRMVRNGAR